MSNIKRSDAFNKNQTGSNRSTNPESFADLLAENDELSDLLDTDDDMGIEDAIDTLDFTLLDFNDKTSSFRFGNTMHKIDSDQAIFSLKGPTKVKNRTPDCASCNVISF